MPAQGDLPRTRDGKVDWAKDVFPIMLETGAALYGCDMKGYWADIGNPEAYLEACRDICHDEVFVQIDEPPITGDGRIFISPDTEVDERAALAGMVVLGGNTRVQGSARLTDSVVGRNCLIDASNPAARSPSSLFTAIRIAWKHRVAGCFFSRFPIVVSISSASTVSDLLVSTWQVPAFM